MRELLAADARRILALDQPGDVDEPDRLARGQRRDRSRRRSSTGASTAWASALADDAASSETGWEADRSGSLMTIAARTLRAVASWPAGLRWIRVISAALSVVGIAAARTPSRVPASALATSTTRPPPSATISSAPPTALWRSAAQLVDEARADVVDGARAGDEIGRRGFGALGGQQGVALAQQLRRVGDRAAAEADRPLAVLPREVHGVDLSPREGRQAVAAW